LHTRLSIMIQNVAKASLLSTSLQVKTLNKHGHNGTACSLMTVTRAQPTALALSGHEVKVSTRALRCISSGRISQRLNVETLDSARQRSVRRQAPLAGIHPRSDEAVEVAELTGWCVTKSTTAGAAAQNRRILFPVTLCLHASKLGGLKADSFAATTHSRAFPAVLALRRGFRWVADETNSAGSLAGFSGRREAGFSARSEKL